MHQRPLGAAAAVFDLNFRSRRRSALRHQEGRDISCILVIELEVRHGGRGGVCLRVFDPGIDPFSAGLFRDVRERRRIVIRLQQVSIGLRDDVAVNASLARKQCPAFIELWARLQAGQDGTARIRIPDTVPAAAAAPMLRWCSALLPLTLPALVRDGRLRSRTDQFHAEWADVF